MSIGIVHENPFAPGYSFHRAGAETLYSEKELDNLNKIINLMCHERWNEQLRRVETLWNVDSLWIIGTRTANYAIEASSLNDVRASRNDAGIQAIVAWKRGGGKDRRIFFPSVDQRWGLEDVSAEELCQAVELVELHLKTELRWSPGHVGTEIMKQFNSGKERANWMEPATFGNMPMKGNMPRDVEMKHGPNYDQLDTSQPIYLHIYDKSFEYGGACTSARLGQGSPEYYERKSGVPFNELYPGLWRLPNGSWKWTPRVAYFIKKGIISTNDLGAAWIWTTDLKGNPRYHQALRAWAKCFWDIDRKLIEYPLARKLLKKIRTQALGWLAHQSEYNQSSAFYRPDWWAMIVEEGACKMEYKMDQLWDKWQIDTVWCNVDEIGILSNEQNHRAHYDRKTNTYIPHPILEREGQLGGFSHRYSILADDTVLNSLASTDSKWSATHDLLLTRWEQTGVFING